MFVSTIYSIKMNKEQSIVSILTPNFNRASFVAETLESILAQTYLNWECIVVDDGSTDNSPDIIKNYAKKDARIKLFNRRRSPKGACTCRNEGVNISTGKYVMFLDTDDLLEPFCLAQRVKTMFDNPTLDFAIFPSLLFRNQPYDLNLWWNIDKPEPELIRQFHQDAICQGTGVLWKKEAFNRIGQWDESLLLWQDIDLFFRAYIQKYKYQKFFDLAPDLHIRRLETSLSRANFFNYDKQMSRVLVIKRAIELLIKNKRSDILREAIYMVMEIVSGLFRSHHFKEAENLLKWASQKQVISDKEYTFFTRLKYLYKGRLNQFSIGENFEKKAFRPYLIENTLGKLAYK